MRPPSQIILVSGSAILALFLSAWPAHASGWAHGTENTVAAALEPSNAMPQAVVTPGKPAVITVKVPAGKTPAPKAFRLTLQPKVADPREPFIVNVYAMPPSGEASAQNLAGSFSFFPPPRPGETRVFTIAIPHALTGADITLTIELVPAETGVKLRHAELAVLDVTIVE